MFTEMYPRMVRYASQLMGDGEEARDIVSEVMEQAVPVVNIPISSASVSG